MTEKEQQSTLQKEFAHRLVERLKAGKPISFETSDLAPLTTMEYAVMELRQVVLEQEAKAIFGPDATVTLQAGKPAVAAKGYSGNELGQFIFRKCTLGIDRNLALAHAFEQLEQLEQLLRFPLNVVYTVAGKGNELFFLHVTDGRLQTLSEKGETCFVELSDLTPHTAYSVGPEKMAKLGEGAMLFEVSKAADKLLTQFK